MAVAVYIVAIDSGGNEKCGSLRSTGLAAVVPGERCLVLTTADLAGEEKLKVSFDCGTVFAAPCVRALSLAGPDSAFKVLARRGWRCGPSFRGNGSSSVCYLSVLRTAEPLSKDFTDKLGQGVPTAFPTLEKEDEGDSWVGTGVVMHSAAPFGLPIGVGHRFPFIQTRGVVANTSNPAGLMLLDNRCLENSAGSGIVLSQAAAGIDSGCLVACLAPLLESSPSDAVAFCIAVPLGHIARALLEDRSCRRQLSANEYAWLTAGLDAHGPSRSLLSRFSTKARNGDWRGRAHNVRRGVALVWLPSGTWASAVVISEQGHLLTCAHFLTGSSWMEVPLDTDRGNNEQKAEKSPPQHKDEKHLPTRCSCRALVKKSDGRIFEETFEADVLHIFDGFLDAALLRVRDPASTSGAPSSLLPIPWHTDLAVAAEGTEVWAVGHGLFGPGGPWIGPSLSRGHLSKVTHGDATQRPTVIQTSAAVHRGCSGGALVDAESGSLLGLITTNVKHQDGSAMPSVNFSFPVALLKPLPDFLNENGIMEDLPGLVAAWDKCAADEQECGFWRLDPEMYDLPSPVEMRRNEATTRLNDLIEAAKALEAESKDQQVLTAPAPRSSL